MTSRQSSHPLTRAEAVIYEAFIMAPYDGFHAQDSARHAAQACGVPVARVHEIIDKVVPGWNQPNLAASRPSPELREDGSQGPAVASHAQGVHPCVDCGVPTNQHIGSYWLSADWLWLKVVGDATTVLCPLCFHARARDQGVHISWRAVCDD